MQLLRPTHLRLTEPLPSVIDSLSSISTRRYKVFWSAGAWSRVDRLHQLWYRRTEREVRL
ncbi:unnamed protein product [Linum tenue]|uniref:Uncharacterized protein n=1 Tax=Linum tenue TaxID=586396 RepID=A0AAV0NEE1_9ROSI|nr:unnamed protein product [Linum tenue]